MVLKSDTTTTELHKTLNIIITLLRFTISGNETIDRLENMETTAFAKSNE